MVAKPWQLAQDFRRDGSLGPVLWNLLYDEVLDLELTVDAVSVYRQPGAGCWDEGW